MWMYLFNLLFYHLSLVLFCWADVTVTFTWLIKFIILLLLLLSFQKSVTVKVVFQSLFVAHFLSVIESPSLPPPFDFMSTGPSRWGGKGNRSIAATSDSASEGSRCFRWAGPTEGLPGGAAHSHSTADQPGDPTCKLPPSFFLFFFGNLLRSRVITSNSGYFPFRSHLCSQSTRSRNKGYVSMRRSWSRPERSFWLCRRRAGNFRRRSRLPRSSSLLFRSLCVTLSHKLHRLKALPWFRTACLQRKRFFFFWHLRSWWKCYFPTVISRLHNCYIPKRMNNSCSDYTEHFQNFCVDRWSNTAVAPPVCS